MNWREKAHSEFERVVRRLVQGIQWRHGVVLAERLRCVAGLVGRHPWFLSEETKSALLEGLAEIAAETTTGVKANDVDGVIGVRSAAAALAYALSEYYEASSEKRPEVIPSPGSVCVVLRTSLRK